MEELTSVGLESTSGRTKVNEDVPSLLRKSSDQVLGFSEVCFYKCFSYNLVQISHTDTGCKVICVTGIKIDHDAAHR